MSSLNRCMFMGLPNSGKSSFIAALWHVVESGEIDSKYSISTLPQNRAYLNHLRNLWLNCNDLDRTKIDFPQNIELNIKNSRSGKVLDFIFPDVSGEMYKMQFEYRRLETSYVEQISSCNGILLFINPDFIRPPILISEAAPMWMDAGVDKYQEKIGAQGEDATQTYSGQPIEVWKPEFSQTQVVLVDLLQIIKLQLPKPCKIGIMISAWDLIKNSVDPDYASLSPQAWLSRSLPLLFQYLRSNRFTLETEYFGISAQGDSYKNAVEKLRLYERPSSRIIVEHGGEISNDITIPIKWLLDGDE